MAAIPTHALAQHWGCDPSRVRQLRTRKESAGPRLPEFEDLGDGHPARFDAADAWRAAYAPVRIRSLPRGRSGPPSKRTPRDTAHTAAPASEPQPPSATLDIEQFDVPTDDFLAFVVAKAERAAKIAYGLYEEACKTRDPVRIQIAMRNCNDAAKHAREVHERFLDLSERARSVISIDRASHIYGLELESLRQLITGMGLRLGPVANPAEPERAQRVIDAEIDRVFERMSVPIDLRTHLASSDPTAAA